MFQTISRKTAISLANRLMGGTVMLSFGAAVYYRPLPKVDSDTCVSPTSITSTSITSNATANYKDRHRHSVNCDGSSNIKHEVKRQERAIEPFLSHDLPYVDRKEIPILLSIARALSIGVTTLAIRLFMNTYGEYQIQDDEHYAHFLKLVLGGDGRQEQKHALLTVSNHRSLFDDPGVVSCILPLWIGLQPKYNRWGICSQEYCFNDALPALIKGYIGAGQVLPIHRGGGINQSLFHDFAKILARGEWCHIFPEGGVWQWKELGGRGRHDVMEKDAHRVKKQKLKWGVGKLIAHHPGKIRIIPFAHVGMETLLPQDPITRRTFLKKELFDGEKLKLRIKFGKEIDCQDLIDDFESKHGKLWKYDHGSDHFVSSTAEMELYRKITSRVEDHLEALTSNVVSNDD